MGAAVFHGGTSTFLAVCIIGFGESFIFEVFFKTWFGMIAFGVLNGLILQPIILSYFGPVNEKDEKVIEYDGYADKSEKKESVSVNKVMNATKNLESTPPKEPFDVDQVVR